jgi:asparagine synthase (glutamine-hydrolysing)
MEGLKRILNYLAQKTTGIKQVFKDDRDYQDYNNWMRYNKKLREYIYNILLDERTQRRPYFNQEYINGILDQHMNGNKNHSELIGRLLTFELWNRQFIDKK